MSKEYADTKKQQYSLAKRFRKFLPVVVDVETAGFNANTDALLEISAIIITMNNEGIIAPGKQISFAIKPFLGANIDRAALEFTGIDPYHPFRLAVDEKDALLEIFETIKGALAESGCAKAILVGHNAAFDLAFVNSAVQRSQINKKNPFHTFCTFDTATLAGVCFGHTVLVKACQLVGIEFDKKQAHSASYDTLKTAELFCYTVNQWAKLGGWPLNL